MTDPGMQLVKVFSERYEELLKLRTARRFEEIFGRNMKEPEYVDYEVIEASKLEDLKIGVKRLLEGGWRTAGGINVTRINSGYPYDSFWYAQAMVKPK